MAYPAGNKPKIFSQTMPPASGVYLLIGQDAQAKDGYLKKLKQEFLSKDLQDFNFDTLYAKEIALKGIQERFLAIPIKNSKRMILVKDSGSLKQEAKDFFLAYSKEPNKQLVLVLEFEHYDYKDAFVRDISPYSLIQRFQETVDPDTFALSRQIELKKIDLALRLLNQLLRKEAPERILGGLRYAWEKQGMQGPASRKRLKLLISCDIEIKTGRLPPAFALEKLVVSLCGFA